MTTNGQRARWTTVRLGDAVNAISTHIDNPSEAQVDRFVGLEHFDSGELKIRRWGTTANLISAMKVFKAGDTLFARRNAYLRRASMVDFDGVCSGDAIVLRPKESVIIGGLLPAILSTDTFWEYALSHAAGSMSKRVNIRNLLSYEFALPPIEEQKRIAEVLWAEDDVLENWRTVQRDLDAMPRSLCSPLLGNRSTGVSTTALGDYVQLVSGQHIPATECQNMPPGVPYLTGPADFADGTIRVSKYVQHPKVMCKKGDILVTCKGSGTGKSVEADQEYCISRQLMAVRPIGIGRLVLKEVLAALSESFNAKAQGLIPGISRATILETRLLLPEGSHLMGLTEVLERLNTVRPFLDSYVTSLVEMRHLLLGLLAREEVSDVQ